MRVLADANVPEEHVSALRGDGHVVRYTRRVEMLGPTAFDDEIVDYAVENEYAILSTDVSDFGTIEAPIPVFLATQNMTGGEVQAAVARVEVLPFDPATSEPVWLSGI